MLSIIVLNYNRLHYTKRTVQNLIDKTTVEHEFIFVDNGSIDGTREYLKDLEHKTNATKVSYVFNKTNLGVAGGRNSGMKISTGDYIMTIDDDIIVPDDYDKLLMEACDIPNMGLTGISVEKKNFKVQEFNGVKIQIKKGNLNGGCLCMSRRVFERVGYFWADFIYGMEDCDMFNRIHMLKLLNGYIMPPALHIDKKENEAYAKLKKKVHKPKSAAYLKMAHNIYRYKKGHLAIYIPYKEPKADPKKFDKAILDGYRNAK